MDRPSRNRKAVNYSVFQDDDDEDFACEKPPPKKTRTAVKDLDSEINHKTTSASPKQVVVELTSSGSRKRTSLDDKLYDRDLEAALTLSLLDSSRTQDGEPTTKTDDRDAPQPVQFSPPVLVHCSADGSHLVGDSHPHPDSPPVLSNCSIDDKSLGLNLISIDASPSSVSKQTESSDEQRKPLKEKDNKDDEDYQPQNIPADSESDADFTEEDESEDETFTVKKKNVAKLKTEKKAPPPLKDKKEKKEKKPTKASKAKSSAPSPAICRSPAAPASGLKKTPNTPPISKPALCSSPAGGRLAKTCKWNPPGLVGRSPGASQNAHVKSPGQGLRLGLSRLARIKPLHPNAAVN